MPRLEIDKIRFKEFLSEFSGDVPYQIELVKTLLAQMPDQVVKGMIEDLYYSKVYEGNLYKAQHVVFKDDVRYFSSFENLLAFLNKINNRLGEYNTDALLTLDKKTVQKRMKDNLPLCGYLITMDEIETKDDKPTVISRFEQFM